MSSESLEQRIEAAIAAAREEVEQRIAGLGVQVNIPSDIPDALIVEMDPDLTLDEVRSYLIEHEGESFKLVRGADDGLDIAAAEQLS